MTFLVVFGSAPELAWQELVTIIPTVERISSHTAVINDAKVDPSELMNRLGGAVKIARLVGVISHVDTTTLTPILTMENFRTFGISTVDVPPVSTAILGQIKKKLGRPARFISGSISSVVITKQHVFEFVVFPFQEKFGVGVTVAVQPFEEWIRRDRGRPHADPRAGMLPPKVARMMVNIALRQAQGKPGTLLDPFCGMGTILGEALLTGWNVIGSDQSSQAIKKTEANLAWLIPSSKHWKLFVSDATHISQNVESVDVIVTEPFLGKPNVSDTNVGDIVTGLEKLYIGCLKEWYSVIKPGGKIVIAFPRFEIRGKTFVVKKAIDSCETLGYTVLAGPIEYARPDAVVRREIFVLQKK